MTVPTDAVEGVASWLASQFRDGVPSSIADMHRDTIVFRVRSREDDRILGEIEIFDEVLEDHSAQTIIADLADSDLVAHMRVDPRFRRTYTTDRNLTDTEVLRLEADGRVYTVIRDRAHNVRVLDSSNRLLQRMPQTQLVLPRSIFARPLEQWQHEIRSWRGPDQ